MTMCRFAFGLGLIADMDGQRMKRATASFIQSVILMVIVPEDVLLELLLCLRGDPATQMCQSKANLQPLRQRVIAVRRAAVAPAFYSFSCDVCGLGAPRLSPGLPPLICAWCFPEDISEPRPLKY